MNVAVAIGSPRSERSDSAPACRCCALTLWSASSSVAAKLAGFVAGAEVTGDAPPADPARWSRSEEHTSELQSLMRTSYAAFCLKKKTLLNTDKINFN